MKTSPLRSPLVLVFLLLLPALPSLHSGFILDDFYHLAMLESWYPGLDEPPRNFYDFYSVPREELLRFAPWWTVDHLKMKFFRPLSNATIRVDHALFHRAALPHHAHSILWFGALLTGCALLYSRLLPTRAALLALAVFALDEAHASSYSWLAHRDALLAITPGVFGLWAHVRWRLDGWRPGVFLAMSGYVLGLLGAEGGAGMLAFPLCFELFGLEAPFKERLRVIAGLVTIGLAWTVWYVLGHFGTAGTVWYANPTGEPLEFLATAALHIPVLLAGSFIAFPPELWVYVPTLHGIQVSLGVLALLAAGGWVAWRLKTSGWRSELRAALWMGAAALMALIPGSATMPFARLLGGPMIGFAVILALVVDWLIGRVVEGSGWRRAAAASAAGLLILLHFAIAPLSRVLVHQAMLHHRDAINREASRIRELIPHPADKEIIVLNSPDPFMGVYLPFVLGAMESKFPGAWRIVSLAPFTHRYRTLDESALELELIDGSMMTTLYEQHFRTDDQLMAVGDRFDFGSMQVTILETGSGNENSGPERLAIRFRDSGPLERVYLAWIDGQPTRVELPEIGEALLLVHQVDGSGPWGF